MTIKGCGCSPLFFRVCQDLTMSDNTPRRSAYARLLDRALRILAMRDHAEQELRRKLTAPVMGKNGLEKTDATPEDVDKVIAWCMENNYLDDVRFARQFIASRSRKGYGPARIRQEMGQKGLARISAKARCENAISTGANLPGNRRNANSVNHYP
jgi:SOS response regulatory protein OraA/RecX